MMVKLLVSRAYWGNGKSDVQEAGTIIEVGSNEAARMVEAMQAEYVNMAPANKVEAAMVEVAAPPKRGRPAKNVEIRNA